MKSIQNLRPKDRAAVLKAQQALKMSRSAHAYVRGSTVKFYEWLVAQKRGTLPEGPAVWICGDCHAGNLGPVADAHGRVMVQIRDLDQTVIGNPAHDLIRLALSLATASRGSDLPGVTTSKILECMVEGYSRALAGEDPSDDMPDMIRTVVRKSMRRTWKNLAKERIDDISPTIPLGPRFWSLAAAEKRDVKRLFAEEKLRALATSLHSRDDHAEVELVDAAYWRKGCSSLGLLRIAALVKIKSNKSTEHSLMDIKEAVSASAPHYKRADMPRDNARRVVQGARQLSPYLGERMAASRIGGKSVFVRELLPQDLKFELEQMTVADAVRVATFLAEVVGRSHARQMDQPTRESWRRELARGRSRSLDAPSWLWTSVVALIAAHEVAYLEHCRKYATGEVA